MSPHEIFVWSALNGGVHNRECDCVIVLRFGGAKVAEKRVCVHEGRCAIDWPTLPWRRRDGRSARGRCTLANYLLAANDLSPHLTKTWTLRQNFYIVLLKNHVRDSWVRGDLWRCKCNYKHGKKLLGSGCCTLHSLFINFNNCLETWKFFKKTTMKCKKKENCYESNCKAEFAKTCAFLSRQKLTRRFGF